MVLVLLVLGALVVSVPIRVCPWLSPKSIMMRSEAIYSSSNVWSYFVVAVSIVCYLFCCKRNRFGHIFPSLSLFWCVTSCVTVTFIHSSYLLDRAAAFRPISWRPRAELLSRVFFFAKEAGSVWVFLVHVRPGRCCLSYELYDYRRAVSCSRSSNLHFHLLCCRSGLPLHIRVFR